MTAEENKALIRRLNEAANQRDDATVDALFADGCLFHSWWYHPIQPDGAPLPDGAMARQPMLKNRDRLCAEFPSMQVTIDTAPPTTPPTARRPLDFRPAILWACAQRARTHPPSVCRPAA